MFYVDQLANLLVFLVCQEVMVVKNFAFMENWVSSKVAGMKKNVFAIFDPAWTHILVPNDPNKEFLKQHFSKERQKLFYDQSCDFKTD